MNIRRTLIELKKKGLIAAAEKELKQPSRAQEVYELAQRLNKECGDNE